MILDGQHCLVNGVIAEYHAHNSRCGEGTVLVLRMQVKIVTCRKAFCIRTVTKRYRRVTVYESHVPVTF